MEEKGLRMNAGIKENIVWYGTGSHAEFRRVSMRCLSHWSGQQTTSSAKAVSTACIGNAVDSSA